MRKNTNPVDAYVKSLLGEQLPSQIPAIESQLIKDDLLGINIGFTEAAILTFLIKSLKVETILEIGTQYGYSTTWMLEALPPHGRIISLEKDEKHHHQAQKNIQDGRCELLFGDAREILQTRLQNQQFDMVFIDANKKAYPDYLTYACDHVKKGGIVVGDNTFLFGAVFEAPDVVQKNAMASAMHKFNQTLFADTRFVSCILPTVEGLTVGYRNI
jgi:predicted O-methyltransferase YrrM